VFVRKKKLGLDRKNIQLLHSGKKIRGTTFTSGIGDLTKKKTVAKEG